MNIRGWWRRNIVAEFPFPDQCWDCNLDCSDVKCSVKARRKMTKEEEVNKELVMIPFYPEDLLEAWIEYVHPWYQISFFLISRTSSLYVRAN